MVKQLGVAVNFANQTPWNEVKASAQAHEKTFTDLYSKKPLFLFDCICFFFITSLSLLPFKKLCD